jgi:hypothetical protein
MTPSGIEPATFRLVTQRLNQLTSFIVVSYYKLLCQLPEDGEIIAQKQKHDATAPSGPETPHYRGFTITLRHTTLGRTPLDEWSARRRHLYLTTHNSQETDIHALGEIRTRNPPASERPQTQALDRAATGIGLTET